MEAGQTVYLGARDLRRGTEASAEVGATPLLLDSNDGASIAAAVDRLRNEVGALDVLVNNAGTAGDQRPPAEATLDDLRRVFETNVFCAAAVLTALTPLLEAGRAPVVVNVSSAIGSLTLERGPGRAVVNARVPHVGGGAQHADDPAREGLPPLARQLRATRAHRDRLRRPPRGLADSGAAPAAGVAVNTVQEGAEIVVRMATGGPEGPTGTFVGNAGPVPW